MTARLYLIGDPVAHSLSPLLHGAMIAQTGADCTYEARRVRAAELPAFLTEAKAACAGFNVTMPLKEAILPLLDGLDASARECGAVNTVCIRQGRAIGHNTDGSGFVDSLRARSIDPAGMTVLLLGAGGAAEAVCTALVKAGAARLYVANRTIDRAHALAARCPEVIRPIPFDGDDLCRAAAESGLLVNATSLGMAGKGEFSDLDFLRRAPDGAVVYDLVYHPRCTRLLQAAAALELSTIPGTELLLYQAVGAFSLFTGCAPDVPALREMLGDAPK